eukprot:6254043-Pyramimonas_sp.AAC.1
MHAARRMSCAGLPAVTESRWTFHVSTLRPASSTFALQTMLTSSAGRVKRLLLPAFLRALPKEQADSAANTGRGNNALAPLLHDEDEW